MSSIGAIISLISAGLFAEAETYVVRGAELTCSEGTYPTSLNLPRSHGVYIKEKSVMNTTDCVVEKNIGLFGFCKKTGTVCQPELCGIWSKGKKDLLIDEHPALVDSANLTCVLGGIISIAKNGGQE
ncbi:DUF4280 domain-containing protein [Paenibacillus glacialis]|uniref:DUF4280 domain-containing protein n=1 Tax=Paenibacillus glacialis TaxID=494026 RepID=A0A168F7A8_9BACL|nr:DUF4280 domain-containing protein [Paenibacillus glacialis]OAB35931.1 hypothetical protein PGLA_21110 [Paenibacillus glacialis]